MHSNFSTLWMLCNAYDDMSCFNVMLKHQRCYTLSRKWIWLDNAVAPCGPAWQAELGFVTSSVLHPKSFTKTRHEHHIYVLVNVMECIDEALTDWLSWHHAYPRHALVHNPLFFIITVDICYVHLRYRIFMETTCIDIPVLRVLLVQVRVASMLRLSVTWVTYRYS